MAAKALQEAYDEKWPHLADRNGSTLNWSDGELALEKALDWPGLLAHCRQLTRAEPDNDVAWYALGFAYANLGRHQDAIKAHRETLRIDPDYANAWYALAVEYGEMGCHQDRAF
ncbi:MAG: tetratricopeptide repeat protein [Deltaproteobacteria bacterium]|nr:tetratricopeptide repeat protein [Deltaproteobacteria bacterium]